MSSAFPKRNTAQTAALCAQRIAALKADVPPKTPVTLDGTATTAAALVALYQDVLDRQAAVATTRAQHKVALAARDAAIAECLARDRALQVWVRCRFGVRSQEAHDFGAESRKAASVSAQTRAMAVQKAKATRVARHTMGKKQRLKIKGDAASQALTATAPPLADEAPSAQLSRH